MSDAQTIEFLMMCIKHAENGKPIWPAVGEAMGIKKDAARMRFKALEVKYGLKVAGGGRVGGKEKKGPASKIEKSTPKKAKAMATKSTPKKRKLVHEEEEEEEELDLMDDLATSVEKPRSQRPAALAAKLKYLDESEGEGEDDEEAADVSDEDFKIDGMVKGEGLVKGKMLLVKEEPDEVYEA